MADTAPPSISLSRLRWPVQLCTRDQAAQADGTGIDETVTCLAVVWADVQAVGAATFWGTEQIDRPVTHRIFLRWVDYVDQTYAVIRVTKRPDEVRRVETFRVRRYLEMGGRKRFAMFEAELEKADR